MFILRVAFENIDMKELPKHVRYKIRQNATFVYTTKNVRKQTWTPGPGQGDHRYYQFGFVWVQDMMDRAIVELQVTKHCERSFYFNQYERY